MTTAWRAFSHSPFKHTDLCVENHCKNNQSQGSSQHRLGLSTQVISSLQFLSLHYYHNTLCFHPCGGDIPDKVKEVIAGSLARNEWLVSKNGHLHHISPLFIISFFFVAVSVWAWILEGGPQYRRARTQTSFKVTLPRWLFFSTKLREVKKKRKKNTTNA